MDPEIDKVPEPEENKENTSEDVQSAESASESVDQQPSVTAGEVITPTNSDESHPHTEEGSKTVSNPEVETVTLPEAAIPVPVDKPKHSWFKPEVILWPALRNKLGSKARPVSLILILLIVAILGGGGWVLTSNKSTQTLASSFKTQVKQFQLVSTIPGKDATNVNAATDITLNFSLPVNASKLTNNMFITPTLNGTFKQGSSPNQVIFKPSQPMTKGVKYSVMINGTLQNIQGTKLGVPFEYSFTTSIPSNAISFQDQNGLYDYVTSLPSNKKENYTLYFGSQVTPTATVTLYKGTVNDMLTSLVYTPGNSSSQPQFSDLTVSTSGLQKVSATPNLKNQSSFSVQQPDGLYVAVATDANGKEVGFVWIDFSNFGVMLRQDDQKTILDAQAFSNSQDVTAQASFYSLDGSVSQLGQKTVDGLTTADYGFDQNLDIVVASSGNEIAVTPVNVLDSGGDIRVDQNLSTAQAVYGVTDKPTYKAGDKINFSGYVRLDNDAQYVNPGSGVVKLYVATSKGNTHLATVNASIDSNGMFSGSLPTQSSWLNSGDNFDQFQLFAEAVGGNPNNDMSVAGFTVAASTNSPSSITVSFSKTSYLPSDQITATIKGVNSNGQPLANTSVQVHVFAEDYYENDPGSNQANFGSFGSELSGIPSTVQLNANGQATYTINPSSLPNDGNSQMVTVQANPANQSGVGAAGGASVVVHQGNAYITFGPTRQEIPSGANLVSDIYVDQLNNNPLSNVAISYSLIDESNSSQLTSGSATTDTNGASTITIPSSSLASNGDPMALHVTTKDQYGNTITSIAYYSVANSSSETFDSSGAGLLDLGVTGTSGNVTVGDTVNLNINAPAAIRAMVTMDRGRIYHPTMVNLNAGDNNYSFNVDSSLAPSFTLTFSYFLNGVYHSEGLFFNVANPAQAANVSIQAPGSTSATQPDNIQISTTDNSGTALPTSLIVDVVSSNSYGLTNQVSPNIFNSFYDSRPIMTSSSSSLSPVGSGGGRCGGGGPELSSFANADGNVLYWNPELVTNGNGQASININPPAGNWTITVYAMSDNTQVGSQTASFTSN